MSKVNNSPTAGKGKEERPSERKCHLDVLLIIPTIIAFTCAFEGFLPHRAAVLSSGEEPRLLVRPGWTVGCAPRFVVLEQIVGGRNQLRSPDWHEQRPRRI